jgi:CheY-like chemotaxis protein
LGFVNTGSPDAYLTLARDVQPEYALLDIGMPEMDGYSLARALRAERWALAVTLVALTGWGQDEDRRRGRLTSRRVLVLAAPARSVSSTAERPSDGHQRVFDIICDAGDRHSRFSKSCFRLQRTPWFRRAVGKPQDSLFPCLRFYLLGTVLI